MVPVLKPIGPGQCGVLQEPGCPRDDRAFVWSNAWYYKSAGAVGQWGSGAVGQWGSDSKKGKGDFVMTGLLCGMPVACEDCTIASQRWQLFTLAAFI